MTIDEAIKELITYNSSKFDNHFVPLSQALQLGIEALKSVKRDRFDTATYHPYLLPGETEK